MINVVVYLKRNSEKEDLIQEYIQNVFNCCLHKNVSICEFYVEKEMDSNLAWNQLICDAKKKPRRWNEIIVPSFELISVSSSDFRKKMNELRKLGIKVTSSQIYTDFYEYITKTLICRS